MSFQPNARVSCLAILRGVSFAQKHFLASHPQDWGQQRIEGVILIAESSGKHPKWRVRWDIDGLESVHSQGTLSVMGSQTVQHQPIVSSSSPSSSNMGPPQKFRRTKSSSVS